MLKRVQHDDCILMRTSVPGDGDVKTKVARQRNVAAKAALRRVRVMIGAPVRVGPAGRRSRWTGDRRAWGASVHTVGAVWLCSDA